MVNLSYLGIAMANPVKLLNGAAGIVGGLAVLNQSIYELMTTPVGTKLFLPEYGARFEELKFEPNDEVLRGMMTRFAFEALQKWETRCQFVDLDFDDALSDRDIGLVMVRLQAAVLPSNRVESFVFPFYRELIF